MSGWSHGKGSDWFNIVNPILIFNLLNLCCRESCFVSASSMPFIVVMMTWVTKRSIGVWLVLAISRAASANAAFRTLYPEGCSISSRSRKIVAAICHAGWMLASADALRGRTVTSFFAIKDDLVHAGADFIEREVVVDGNIITSRTPDDLPPFMRAIISALA
ncbi:MAG: DJ-1/PfpI family protein [Deltaproteobacteria bacterium]|nr:DJ-1/PfpI family protein [Deltaproteobacteria bacterium]